MIAAGANEEEGQWAIACGSRHTLLLSRVGVVFACGEGACHKLGFSTGDEKGRRKPYPIDSLDGQRIAGVAAGAGFTAFRTAGGDVLTCGEGLFGQLGHGDGREQPTPKRVDGSGERCSTDDERAARRTLCRATPDLLRYTTKALHCHSYGLDAHCRPVALRSPERRQDAALYRDLGRGQIAAIAAGAEHLVLVTRKGEVFTCGFAARGALGLGAARSAPSCPWEVNEIGDRHPEHVLKNSRTPLGPFARSP